MSKRIKSVIRVIIIVAIVVIDAYPIFWLLTSAMKSPTEFTANPSYSLPEGFYYQNFVNGWTRGHMGRYFLNSLFYTVVALLFIILITVPVSFALTKMRWKGREFFSNYFLTGLMVPVATALLPLFQIYSKMGILNTRFCLIITYIAFGLSLSIFLMCGYMRSLSDEILEASVIDGCGIFKMMWYIVVPLMKNGIVTVLVLQFFYKWNDLLFSMTFVSDSKLKTIQTGLLYFTDEFGTKDWGSIFASIAISVLPMLVIYLFLNKKVVEGMTNGAVKG